MHGGALALGFDSLNFRTSPRLPVSRNLWSAESGEALDMLAQLLADSHAVRCLSSLAGLLLDAAAISGHRLADVDSVGKVQLR